MTGGFTRYLWQLQDAKYAGVLAYRAGKSLQDNPYKRADLIQEWIIGFTQERDK